MATATKPMMLDETGKQIVDELKKIAEVKGSAIGTTFDDSNAHLGTNNVQGAIDKLKSNADTLTGKVTTAEQNISTNTQNIATNAAAISQHSSQIAEISDEIKVEKSVVVDDYALVDSGSGIFNDLVLYGRSHQDGTPTPENPSAIRALDRVETNGKTEYKNECKVNGTTNETGAVRNGCTIPINKSATYVLDLSTTYVGYVCGLFRGNTFVKEIVRSQLEVSIEFDAREGDEVHIWGTDVLPQYMTSITIMVKGASTESALPTLYGKEVESGGNYTDLEGKKWLSDVLRIEHGDIERYLGVRKPPYTESDIVALNDTYGRGQIQLATTSKHGTWAIMSNCFCTDITDGDSAGYLFASSMNWGDSYRVIFTLGSAFNTKAKIADELNRIGAEFVYELPTPTTEPIPQSVLNSIRQLRSFADKTHIYCDNGSLEAVIAENTEVGNAIGRNAIKINEILNLLNPVTASVAEE